MNITYNAQNIVGSACPGYIYKEDRHEDSVEAYIAGCISATAWRSNGNALDDVITNDRNLRGAFGRLCEVLADKGILNLDELLRIAGDHRHSNESLHALAPETQ